MLSLVLAAASAIAAVPPEPLKGQLQAAIWADLQLNAMIGSGNWLASLWYQAGSNTAPDLHIRRLACVKKHSQQRCSFFLYRDGGLKMVSGEKAPAELACFASFSSGLDGWSVVHTPPRQAGQSRTSMRCKVA
jgi:hypothetical protein